jgi:hypothetical protein
MPKEGEPRRINANPTRALFVRMLTKDVDLDSAILDLVDNSVDAANDTADGGDLAGFEIRLTIEKNFFEIADTCGGMSIADAETYAFRFGRPEQFALEPGSIGRFGVGMKRSLFKLGKQFTVTSRTPTESFEIDVDVDNWVGEPSEVWSFTFSQIEQGLEPLANGSHGMKLSVRKLYKSVSASFGDEIFLQDLVEDIKTAHHLAIERGLGIQLNGDWLEAAPEEIIASDLIKPARQVLEFGGEPPLTATIVTGIGLSEPRDAGWYVYCNGRLILRADQSNVTGWKERAAAHVPRYHNQYSRFRGFVFFLCDDATRLPFNTTKSGMDQNNDEYRATRLKMIKMMSPVLTFLNQLDRESDSDDQPLTNAVELSMRELVMPHRLEADSPFTAPEPSEAVEKSKLATISYKKSRELVDNVKAKLNVSSNREVGEETFDYYAMMEMDDV